MLKTSTEIGSILKNVNFDDKLAIKLVKDAGFDAFDYSMHSLIVNVNPFSRPKYIKHPFNSIRWKSYAKKLRKYIDDLSFECNQCHAPFPIYNKCILKTIKKAIIYGSLLGAKICVIHPDNYKSVDENSKIFSKLLKVAKKHNIIIATENMWDWDMKKNKAKKSACSHHLEFKEMIDKMDSPYFKGCIDIGHANMEGLDTTPSLMIETLKNDMVAMHLHDNDLKHDSHQIPFSMKIDFDKVAESLKKINYQGYITLEAAFYIKKEDKNIEEKIKDLYKSADKFRKMVQ